MDEKLKEEEFLKKIKKGEITSRFGNLPEEFQTTEFFEKVVKVKPSFLASHGNTGDSEFMRRMVAANSETLQYAQPNLLGDKEFILYILSKCPDKAVHMVDTIGNNLPWIDTSFALKAVAVNAKAIKLIEKFNPDLLKDKDFAAICQYAQNPTKENYNLFRDRLDLRDKSIYSAFLEIAEKGAVSEMKKQKGVKSTKELLKIEDFKKILTTTLSEIKKDIDQRTSDLVTGKASLTEDVKEVPTNETNNKPVQEAQEPNNAQAVQGEAAVEVKQEVKKEEPAQAEVKESVTAENATRAEHKVYSSKDFEMKDSGGKLRKKFDVDNENDMDKLFEFYAQMNVAYYNKKNKTAEEVKLRRNVNSQFKRIIEKKVNALADEEKLEDSNFEQKIEEINNGTLFPENEIDEIAKSKGATIKLFQIFASGVYEKDGVRTRLSKKQRCALANVLQKVSEKKLDIESAKLGEKDKTDKVNKGAEKVNESEKGE